MVFLLDRTFGPWASNSNVQDILLYVHFSSPIILIVFFLIVFTAHSIATASVDPSIQKSKDRTGPGGKLLPSRSPRLVKDKPALDFSPARKLLFTWLSVGTIATFVANAAAVILHALVDRKNTWWCGQSVAVCLCDPLAELQSS